MEICWWRGCELAAICGSQHGDSDGVESLSSRGMINFPSGPTIVYLGGVDTNPGDVLNAHAVYCADLNEYLIWHIL